MSDVGEHQIERARHVIEIEGLDEPSSVANLAAAALTGETRSPSGIPAMVLHNDANKLVVSRPGSGTAIPGSGFTLVVLNPYNSSAS